MAQIYFDIDIQLAGTDTLLRGLNLEQGGLVQRFFTSEVIRLSDKYVPFRAGILKNSVHPAPDFGAIFYTTPYARYHWFGKLMVDPITGKGSFFDPLEGRHWSRPNTQKVLTDRDMQYQGAPCAAHSGQSECGKQKEGRSWNLPDCLLKGIRIYDDN